MSDQYIDNQHITAVDMNHHNAELSNIEISELEMREEMISWSCDCHFGNK
jgi:hypothetical protein